MFKKNVILFLKRDSLELYLADNDGPKNRLQFPPEIIKYEEIISEAKFESLITSFLQKELAPNQKVTILLSPNILFQKTISSQDKAIQESEDKKFRDEIPFDASKTAIVKVPTTTGLNLIATNKKLYLSIISAVEKTNSQVEAVLPLTLFGITKELQLTKDDIAQVFKNPKLVNAGNFLLAQQDTDPQIDQEAPKSFLKNNKNILFIIFAALIVISGITFVFIKQKKQSVSPKKEAEITQATLSPTPAEESTTSAEMEGISKDVLKIQILNGTGVAGQAQDLADLLKSDGFGNFTLGNSTTADNTQTTVSFKNTVAQSVKNNLIQKLEEIFENVKVENIQESDFDIEITTGKLKTP